MISRGKDIKVFSGNANPKLAADICKYIGIKLGESEVGCFSDGENYASIYETVRGSDVFLIQSTCMPVNDNLMELLIMIDAMRRASAGPMGRRRRGSKVTLAASQLVFKMTAATSRPARPSI